MTAVSRHLPSMPFRSSAHAREQLLLMASRTVGPGDANETAPMAEAAEGLAPACNAQFAAFYDQNYRQLVVAFTSALGDQRLAEDTAQEAMLRACQRWNKIGEYDNPSGWCYRVGMNWATSRWRKRRREVSSDEPMSINAVAAGEERPDQALVDAIHSLPDQQREVVVLRIWMDWSVRETSVALDIPEGTVRSRQTRGLKRLRSLLEGTEGYEDRGPRATPARIASAETSLPNGDGSLNGSRSSDERLWSSTEIHAKGNASGEGSTNGQSLVGEENGTVNENVIAFEETVSLSKIQKNDPTTVYAELWEAGGGFG